MASVFRIKDWKTGEIAFEAPIDKLTASIGYRVHPSHKEDTQLGSRPFTIPEISRAKSHILHLIKMSISERKAVELSKLIADAFKNGKINRAGFTKLAKAFDIQADQEDIKNAKAKEYAKARAEERRRKRDEDRQNARERHQKKTTNDDWTKWERTSAEDRKRNEENARAYRAQFDKRQRDEYQRRCDEEAYRRVRDFMAYKDPHETLGVSRNATADEIKAAYRKLSFEYHPDTTKLPIDEAKAKFNQIAQAYQNLKRRA